MNRQQIEAAIRRANVEAEAEMLATRERIRQERLAETPPLTPEEIISAEMDEVVRPYEEGWKVER